MTDAPLDRAAAMSFVDYSPALVVEAVNELRAAGREVALERIRSAAAQVPGPPDATGLIWVMRVLFDLPPGMPFPPVALGTPDVPPPSNADTFPRFPIVIFCDVPFLVARGYVLAGLPAELDDDVAFYYDYGAVRPAPLTPAPAGPDLEREFLARWAAAYQDEPAPDISDIVRGQTERLATDA